MAVIAALIVSFAEPHDRPSLASLPAFDTYMRWSVVFAFPPPPDGASAYTNPVPLLCRIFPAAGTVDPTDVSNLFSTPFTSYQLASEPVDDPDVRPDVGRL